ncbi:MAG: hypothetical protein ACRD6X_22615, partial [Pyrinomonadaceae bacterium]
REGAPFDAEIRSKPIESGYFLHIITNGIIIPAAFLIVGLFVFLFKPDTWLTVLCAIAFALIAASTSPLCFISYAEASFLNVFLWQLGYISSLISGVVLLHFILYFPKPSWLLRRFPKLPVLIYLPFLIYVLPTEIGLQFAWNGFTQFDFIYEWSLLYFADLLYTPYLLADLVVLFLNYRQSDEAGRRRMRILLFGIPLAILPFMFVDSVLPSIEWLTGKTMFSSTSMKELVANLPIIIAPPVFAYAVVKNRVIPISIIVRRGIQYLFAKNGLRLLVLLPLAGIVLNLVDNPDRTLGEIVFRNSGWFYFFAISTIGFALLSRFRLNEWIDRKFFREQFDQERLLRG